MSREQPSHNPEPPGVPEGGRLAWLFLTVLDTTWRIFVPSLSGIALGYLVDQSWQLKPWGLIVGLLAGTVISVGLVVNQLRRGETSV